MTILPFSIYLSEVEISIHIPRVGDDAVRGEIYYYTDAISIHIPRVGDDVAAIRVAD